MMDFRVTTDIKLPEPAFPQLFYCNKCGQFPLQAEHEGCHYNAVSDGTGHKYSADQLRAAIAAERDEANKRLAAEYERTYGAIQDGLLAQVQSLRAEVEALQADAERIEHLESLMRRTQFQNNKRPTESVGSDMHMGDGRCALYVRDLFGNTVNAECGYGESVRAAIDAAMTHDDAARSGEAT